MVETESDECYEAKIPINPYSHYWFMIVIKGFDLEMRIEKGFYVITYNDPADLYLLGLKMADKMNDFLSDRCKFNK